MEEEAVQPMQREQEEPGSAALPTEGKKPWQEPKLAFIEPKLTRHGKLEDVTAGGFFGVFSP